MYCPSCGNDNLNSFTNNNPVGDFFCLNCKSEYELKSNKNATSLKIVDGAYKSMIERISANNNPNFFFLNYSDRSFTVINFFVIPKHYFIFDVIEKRKPLSHSAIRAGWTGCNILLQNIPSSGRIFFVKNGQIEDREVVLENWRKTSFLSNQKPDKRQWTIEIIKLIEAIPSKTFALQDIYQYESTLKQNFPSNNSIKDKIRQQLQILRDKGLIEFKGNGKYSKI
ncbi:DpnI domain-containing protein [uncultured Spirosoma sp.]|uniref:DpnI domain-containing protein n=1 Tax=uncultured Spirosoma sp. TaxID=278208 RepID=UPI002587597B|nr:DpnI domain-containing protein [uncultured Spirosoma sp.]